MIEHGFVSECKLITDNQRSIGTAERGVSLLKHLNTRPFPLFIPTVSIIKVACVIILEGPLVAAAVQLDDLTAVFKESVAALILNDQ